MKVKLERDAGVSHFIQKTNFISNSCLPVTSTSVLLPGLNHRVLDGTPLTLHLASEILN